MERQESNSSSISLNSWGSDLAEEGDHSDYQGFNFSKHHLDHRCSEPNTLIQPEVLWRERSPDAQCLPSCGHPYLGIHLPQRLPMSLHDREWTSLVLMMKERYAKLLLGEDFSGGSKASNTALTISNAITKLSVSIFGDLWRLEPLCQENKLRWKREMEWLISPCDYIVELVPVSESLEDGSSVDVMASKPRSDVYVALPALQKLDSVLLEILESFSNSEFWYTESAHETSGDFRGSCEVWIPVAKVPSCGLSEQARRQLTHQRESANHALRAAKSINEHVLSEMEIPDSYWKTLPKSGKKVMAHTPLKIITSEFCCFETLLSTLDYPSYESLSHLANGLESLIQVWTLKIKSRLRQLPYPDDMSCRPAPTWSHVSKDASLKKLEKKRKYVERSQALLSELRHRFPGLLQTSLELLKIQHNKDVGYAVLESYSRVLVNLAARIQTRIGEIISADRDAVLSRLQSLNANSDNNKMGLEDQDSLTAWNMESQEPRRLSTDSMMHLGMQLEQAL